MKHKTGFELNFEDIKGSIEVIGTIDDSDYSFDTDKVIQHIADTKVDLTFIYLSANNVPLRLALNHQIEKQFDLQDELNELLESEKEVAAQS